MSGESIGALARRWSQAFNERDMEGLAELTTEDFEFVPYLGSLIEANVYRGLDGLRREPPDDDLPAVGVGRALRRRLAPVPGAALHQPGQRAGHVRIMHGI